MPCQVCNQAIQESCQPYLHKSLNTNDLRACPDLKSLTLSNLRGSRVAIASNCRAKSRTGTARTVPSRDRYAVADLAGGLDGKRVDLIHGWLHAFWQAQSWGNQAKLQPNSVLPVWVTARCLLVERKLNNLFHDGQVSELSAHFEVFLDHVFLCHIFKLVESWDCVKDYFTDGRARSLFPRTAGFPFARPRSATLSKAGE